MVEEVPKIQLIQTNFLEDSNLFMSRHLMIITEDTESATDLI